MTSSAYTLLIVESPVLARIIQNHAPSSVYVMATGGFCWHPVYDAEKNKLITRADPGKREFRKELKEQAQWAGNIIVATDTDPSGDFIAWSIARFLKSAGLKRGCLQNPGKNSILKMLSEAEFLDISSLTNRLRNRFLIRREWSRSSFSLTMHQAGLVSILGHPETFQTFEDENGNLFKSTEPISCNTDEWIPIRAADNDQETYHLQKPLSAFDVIGEYTRQNPSASFSEIQSLLQQLFQTVLPISEESLISYPRTLEKAFYSETWNTLQNQFLKFAPLDKLKPPFLQQIARPNSPHESIHPLNLALVPEHIRGELPRDIYKLYKLIYQQTMEALKIPGFPEPIYRCDFYPETRFYPAEISRKTGTSICPRLTVAELGHALNELGVQNPSSFGKALDQWTEKKWISTSRNFAEAGEALAPYLSSAGKLKKVLTSLQQVSDSDDLDSETVKSIITS